jgi:hypothetical protein
MGGYRIRRALSCCGLYMCPKIFVSRNMNTVVADFKRFAHLHSYCKKYPPSGVNCRMELHKGYQSPIRGTQFPDPTGMHWWFFECKDDEYPHFRINSFTRGLEKSSWKPQVRGFRIVVDTWPDELMYLCTCELIIQRSFQN